MLLAVASLRWGPVPLVAVAGFSLAAFLTYRTDKRAAIEGRWRVPEMTLHLLALGGGWSGALLAQQRFRHKTAKPSFQVAFWATGAGVYLALVQLLFAWPFTGVGGAGMSDLSSLVDLASGVGRLLEEISTASPQP